MNPVVAISVFSALPLYFKNYEISQILFLTAFQMVEGTCAWFKRSRTELLNIVLSVDLVIKTCFLDFGLYFFISFLVLCLVGWLVRRMNSSRKVFPTVVISGSRPAENYLRLRVDNLKAFSREQIIWRQINILKRNEREFRKAGLPAIERSRPLFSSALSQVTRADIGITGVLNTISHRFVNLVERGEFRPKNELSVLLTRKAAMNRLRAAQPRIRNPSPQKPVTKVANISPPKRLAVFERLGI
ncbi:hypothetical protein G9A89_006821 [Geosiphon pyriformis]|nr:hypothetical protein G9A89_006821 [Geosiphon pyriformis]